MDTIWCNSQHCKCSRNGADLRLWFGFAGKHFFHKRGLISNLVGCCVSRVSSFDYHSICVRLCLNTPPVPPSPRPHVMPRSLDDVCSQPLPTDKRYLERLHVAFSRRKGQGMDVAVSSSRDPVSLYSQFNWLTSLLIFNRWQFFA